MAVEIQTEERVIASSGKVYLDLGDGIRRPYIGDLSESKVNQKVSRFPSHFIEGPSLSVVDGHLAADPTRRTGIYLQPQESTAA